MLKRYIDNRINILTALWVWCALLLIPINSLANTDLSTKFEYTLRVSVDYAKRESYLKRSGDQPSPYEKLLKSVNGSVELADIVDTVNFSKNQYSIRSIGTLKGAIGLALSSQSLLRDSIGKRTPTGFFSINYQEKRGSTEPFASKFDVNKKQLNFSVNTVQVGSASVQGSLLDPIVIPYLFIGKSFPGKSTVVQLTDGRSIKRYSLIRAESIDFPFNGSKVRAIRFYKTTSKEDPTSLQVWFSEKEHAPLRYIIGLKDQYGVTLQVDLKKMPRF